ncbi:MULTISPECIES: N-acetylneuraminate synthase family protein [Spirulina sp. CCY15215]|uniref:N-acetylneuraminate synthase family protein n=1 Tax=Spirulina sp. CCY15215 TaxID=2767591 RepID=UPI0019522F5A
MKIGKIDLNKQVLIVAEIGNNHEGNFSVAQKLVQEAASCGVDAVKFQTFKTEHYVSHSDRARFERLKSFELSQEQFTELSQLARSLNLIFISTPFDLGSAEFLAPLVDCYKVASSDNTFYPLIRQITTTGKSLIISCGLSNFSEIQNTVKFVEQQSIDIQEKLAILHCVSSYPVPKDQANLRSIQFLADRFNCTVGYSDHTLGIEAAVLAVGLGARIIEKHFTLDRHYSDFRDHQLSADPKDMEMLVNQIRRATLMLGQYNKNVQPCEKPLIRALRRSIIAINSLPCGHRLTELDLTWVRPGGGVPPGEENVLVGKILKRNIKSGQQILIRDVESFK